MKSLLLFSLIFFSSCGIVSDRKKIEPSSVSYIVLSVAGNPNFKTLNKDQQKKFVEDWNSASSIGPCIFITRDRIDVVFNDTTKRAFRINGNYIKENTDQCYDLGDTAYFEKLWQNAK
jgi:hypothetical protein